MSSAALSATWRRRFLNADPHRPLTGRRSYSSIETPPNPPKASSPHAQFYSDLVPGMIPIALLGSAIYLGLRLWQSNLSHEKYLDAAREKITALETEIEALRLQEHKAGQADSVITSSASSKRWWLW